MGILRGHIGSIVVILLSWSSVVYGYIPPSHYILKTWLSKHVSTKTLRIQTVVNAIENNQLTDVHFKDITIFNVSTLSFHCLAINDQDQLLYWVDKNPNFLSVIAFFLFSSDVQRVELILKKYGVPMVSDSDLMKVMTEGERRSLENESLTRWNGSLAWQIGNQLWFEKDTFIPLRLFYSSSIDQQVYDFRFEGSRFFREFHYPKIIKLYKKNEATLVSQLSDIGLYKDNSKWSSNQAGTLNTGTFTHEGDVASSSLKNLIQLYYESFR